MTGRFSPDWVHASNAWLWCRLFGHKEGVLIWHRGLMLVVCPRCGEKV